MKEKLYRKENQLKDTLSLVEFLTKDNKELKIKYNEAKYNNSNKNLNDNNEYINNEIIENNNKYLFEMKKKEKEISDLKKELREISSFKTNNEEIEYYKNRYNIVKNINTKNESIIEKLKAQINDNYDNNSPEINNLSRKSIPSINMKFKANKNNLSKQILNRPYQSSNKNLNERRSLSVISSEIELNKNFNRLFNESEKKALFTLFKSEEEFQKFNQKFDILEKNYTVKEKRYKQCIKELTQSNEEKEEQIQYLRDKIKENEMKLKILLNQIKFERLKNDGKKNSPSKDKNTNTNFNNTSKQSVIEGNSINNNVPSNL